MYKVCCVLVGVAMFLPLWILAQPNPHAGAADLAAMRDKSRPLLIFYPESQDKQPPGVTVSKQRELLRGHDAELQDRDVILMYIPWSASTDLRKQFQIDDRQFTVLLVGKDGGEKFRSHQPVTIEKLNALIDAMPMRQREVQDGHPE